MNEKVEPLPLEDMDAAADWETLDSRVSTAVQEIESALEEALAATRDLGQWVERLRTLSTFMRQVESGLVEVRQQLQEQPSGRPVASVVRNIRSGAGRARVLERPFPEPETTEKPLLTALEALEDEGSAETPEAIAVAEAGEPAVEAVAEAEAEQPTTEAGAVAEAEQPAAPAEAEPSEAAGVAEASADVCLEIQSSEANIDLMVVERALRETPGVADVDLMDYAGKRARVRVTLKEGERPEETANPQHLAASVKERLAKLTWDGSLSVGLCEQS
jgi:hypothetical protein